MHKLTRCLASFLVGVSIAALTGCGTSDAKTGQDSTSGPAREVTVLLPTGYGGAWPTGLDPGTNLTARANLSQMNAIFGGLFQLVADDDGGNPKVAGVLASGYEILRGGLDIAIHLREGVTFSDGTPFDAEAVRKAMERNLTSPCTCAPNDWPWAGEKFSTPSRLRVVLHFSKPFAAAINSFPATNLNWIASSAAFEKIGAEAFRLAPVGAGPFKVVHNDLNSTLVLERNPTYWEKGRPYLERLVFKSIGNEQAAIQSLLAGDAMVYEGMTSPALIEQARATGKIVVTLQPPTSPYVIQLNTARKPFDDQRAREAIYHATDVAAIRQGIFKDWYPVSQSFTASGGLFHTGRVDGYRAHDLARARAIVKEMGGLDVELGTTRTGVAELILVALQTQWREAGINVSIHAAELPSVIQELRSGEWQAMLQTAGSFDPEAGAGVSFRFRSDQPYTGVHDPDLDRLLVAAAETFDEGSRADLYAKAGQLISDKAYAPFLVAHAPAQLSVPGLVGPGLTTRIPAISINTAVLWQDVRWQED